MTSVPRSALATQKIEGSIPAVEQLFVLTTDIFVWLECFCFYKRKIFKINILRAV